MSMLRLLCRQISNYRILTPLQTCYQIWPPQDNFMAKATVIVF